MFPNTEKPPAFASGSLVSLGRPLAYRCRASRSMKTELPDRDFDPPRRARSLRRSVECARSLAQSLREGGASLLRRRRSHELRSHCEALEPFDNDLAAPQPKPAWRLQNPYRIGNGRPFHRRSEPILGTGSRFQRLISIWVLMP